MGYLMNDGLSPEEAGAEGDQGRSRSGWTPWLDWRNDL